MRKSFGFIPFTNPQLLIPVFSDLQFSGYIQHTNSSVHILLCDILLGEICQHTRIMTTAFGFNLDSTHWGIHFDNFDPIDRLQQTALQTSRFTARGSMVCSTIWNNNLTLMGHSIFSTFMSGLTKVISTFTLSRNMIDTMTSVCLLVSHCNTCVTRTIISLLEKYANLKWPTYGHFRHEEEVVAVLIWGHIPDPLQIMAESLSLNFQKLISMVFSLAVGTEQIGCSSFSPNLVKIETFYWMIILPKLQSPQATEHPMLMDNALKIFKAIWNATLETMILQCFLTLPQFLSAESIVVHSFAINDLAQSHKSQHNILLEQFGARQASLDLAYFNFHDNGTWCFELIIKLVRSVGVQLDHTIYNHAILGLWTAKSLDQTCTVMYGVLSHFGNVHDIKTWAISFADHSFMVKELSCLAELIHYCVDDAN
ncbi:hypothetical protein D8674_040001 [Pyrus ussuriensis x Pyrus communis]|uniref:Exportin-2 central domain-containing protein n=1 Tax=Pyrus ussuriensis x Pyrus communis TaxID=2448454 RepID=A0A5N5GWR5_9ROSA|nr:hypothetical protein D8674_040001 [Pyrus ussuriensis x Pyrus communis]